MDDKAKPIIIAVGVGALGTLLAYLGYNAIIDNNKDTSNIEQPNVENDDIKSDENNDENNKETEVKETSFRKNEEETKKSVFFDFWKSDKAKKEVEKELINKKINLEKDKDSESNNNEDKETNDKTDYNKFYHY